MTNLSILDDGFRFELKQVLRSRSGQVSLTKQLQAQLKAVVEQLEHLPQQDANLNILLIAADDVEELEHIEALLKLVRHRVRELEQPEMERLIDMAMPRVEIRQAQEVLDQARRNANLRARFLETYPCLDAEAVHTLYGSNADNTAALASKWRKAGKIFGLDYQGRTLYPAFQFAEGGKPKPAIARILKALGSGMGAWQTALWFTSANPNLGRHRPLELLDDDSEQVVQSAQALTQPNLF